MSLKTQNLELNLPVKIPIFIGLIICILASIRIVEFRLEAVYFINQAEGDENIFLSHYSAYKEFGFWHVVSNGTSPIFILVIDLIQILGIYPNDDLMAMRFVSILSLCFSLLVISFHLIKSVRRDFYKYFLLSFLIMVALMQRAFFIGYNDGLFTFLVILSLMAFLNLKSNSSKFQNILIGFLFGLSLGVRETFVFYILGIIFIVFHYYKRGILNSLNIIIIILSFLITTTMIFLPSIVENKKILFLSKEPSNGMFWAQKNYLEILESERKSWDDVNEYLQNNGDESLPKSIISAMVYDIKLTLKNAIRQLFLINLPFLRQTGFIYLIFIVVFLRDLIMKRDLMNIN